MKKPTRQVCVNVAQRRSEPATKKQKSKLQWFGFAFDANISKGEASHALDKCVREYPEKETAYYNRPATKEQLAQIRKFNQHPDFRGELFYDFENGEPLNYGQAKDIIKWAEHQREIIEMDREIEEYELAEQKRNMKEMEREIKKHLKSPWE